MSEEMNKGSIILYQTPDGQSKIEVTLSKQIYHFKAHKEHI